MRKKVLVIGLSVSLFLASVIAISNIGEVNYGFAFAIDEQNGYLAAATEEKLAFFSLDNPSTVLWENSGYYQDAEFLENYLVATTGGVVKVYSFDGNLIWSYDTGISYPYIDVSESEYFIVKSEATILFNVENSTPIWSKTNTSDASISPDGNTIATVSGGDLYVYDRSGELLWSKEGGYSVVSISTEGKILVSSEPGVWVFDINGNLLWENLSAGGEAIDIYKDTFSVGSMNSKYVYYFSLDSTKPIWTWKSSTYGPEVVEFSSNGKYIFVSDSWTWSRVFTTDDNIPIFSKGDWVLESGMDDSTGYFATGYYEPKLYYADYTIPPQWKISVTSSMPPGEITLKWPGIQLFNDHYEVEITGPEGTTTYLAPENYLQVELEAKDGSTVYYWKVRGVAIDGTKSEWSATNTLTVEEWGIPVLAEVAPTITPTIFGLAVGLTLGLGLCFLVLISRDKNSK